MMVDSGHGDLVNVNSDTFFLRVVTLHNNSEFTFKSLYLPP